MDPMTIQVAHGQPMDTAREAARQQTALIESLERELVIKGDANRDLLEALALALEALQTATVILVRVRTKWGRGLP